MLLHSFLFLLVILCPHVKHERVIYLDMQERGASVVESVIITYKNPECGGTVILGSQDQEIWSDPLLDTKGES